MDEKMFTVGAPAPSAPPSSREKNSLEGAPSALELPRIRTYAGDMSVAIKKRGETLASIVNKEHTAPKKTVEQGATPGTLRGTLVAIISAVLVLAGIGTLLGVFLFKPPVPGGAQGTPSIIFANETYYLPLEGGASLSGQLDTTRAREDLLLGELMRIVPTDGGVALSPSELAKRLGAPDALAREVTSAMIGIHAFEQNQPFIIFTVSAYDRSFAALLAWEKDMARTLSPFFAPKNVVGATPTLSFSDAIIRNLDVRQSGSAWPVLYAFPSQNTIIITTNEFTLREVLTRLNSSSGNLTN
jgi:hypothetical protein